MIDLLGNCSLRRLKRLLLVPYLLHGPGRFLDRFPVSPSGPGQSLDRHPVSPSPCSRALAGERPITPLAPLSPDISLHRTTMRLDIVNLCARSSTMLATIT